MVKEWLARFVVLGLVAAAAAIPAGAWWLNSQSIVIHAQMAESGGWTPENLMAEVGQPLHLRLTSEDVMHSFAIGQSDRLPVDVIPGEVTEVTLVFDQPGKYTFYCTRWCGVNHWRMRGTIEVTGPGAGAQAVEQPLYAALGLDIDAAIQADALPEQVPSARRGAQLAARLPAQYQNQAYYRANSPVDLWQALQGEAGLSHLTDTELWDLVALAWQSYTTPQELSAGQQLYATNCAACHGETGAGDGVFAAELDQPATGEHREMQAGEMTTAPTDFTDPEHMLAASPARLQGKILRGGMGTGMPYWGPIFTEEQTWALVAYLWTFQFELEDQP